jgi:hypothetical protein
MLMNIILIMAKKRLNLTNLIIEMYPAEGPMLKAPVAPDPLIVSCSKSWTTVGAGRCTQCRPSNVHREVDKADPRKKGHHQEGDENVPMKKKMTSSRGDTPHKSDRPTHTRAGVPIRTPVPEACSPKAPCAWRMGRGVLGCNSTGGRNGMAREATGRWEGRCDRTAQNNTLTEVLAFL